MIRSGALVPTTRMSTRPDGGTNTLGSRTIDGFEWSNDVVVLSQLTGTPSRPTMLSHTVEPFCVTVRRLTYESDAALITRYR